MKVLVTGSTGLVGTALLKELDHDVVGLTRRDGDLAADGVADRLLDKHAPDVVVHLAAAVAKPGVAETVRDNVDATALVAAACASHDARLLHGSTTSIGATSLYAAAKRWSEEAALFFVPGATLLRLAYPYGPARGAITTMIAQALRRDPITVHRGSVRSWCWVGDAARAIALLVENCTPGTVTIGNDREPTSMFDLARLVCALTDAPEGLIEEIEPPYGPTSAEPYADTRLESLGWRPNVSLEDGVQLLVAGYSPAAS
ncbi:MAG TPA: sugar nucleotide-binding protein [Gaiellaceae bacterium]|nr:sugar nucleotide-binding protein [Gaiellaceae bacterium]